MRELKWLSTILVSIILVVTCVAASFAQQPTLQDPLLESLTGKWLLTGTVGKTQTVHDVDIRWVLSHQFVQIHEVSHEKNAGKQSEPQYEALVMLGWDADKKQYVVYWTDVFGGGFSLRGYATKTASSIPIVFPTHDGNFYTIFDYDQRSDSWRWSMDNEQGGRREEFARFTLTRQRSK